MARADHEVRDDPRTDVRRPWWRKLDLTGPDGKPFLRRRGFDLRRGGGLLVHRIDAPDPGLDLHDHPWWFVTLILRGGYTEHHADVIKRTDGSGWLYCPGCGCATCSHRPEGCRWHPTCTAPGLAPVSARTWPRWSIHRMPLNVAHRITECEPNTITLVIRGPKVRRWGFFMPSGWIDWEAYPYEERRPLRARSNRPGEDR